MFWIGAGLLVLLACAFVILPLIVVRRDDVSEVDRDQLNVALYVERTDELQDQLLTAEAQKDLLADTSTNAAPVARQWGDRRILFIVALLLPVFAYLIYGDSGLGRGAIADVAITERLAKLDPSDTESAVRFALDLERRLTVHPEDDDMQYLLASVYGGLGRYSDAVAIYESMLSRYPDDVNLLSRYAEGLFVAEERRLTPRVLAAIDSALKVNPVDVAMLEIRGIGEVNEGRPAEALIWFKRALGTGVTGRRAELLRIAIARIEQQGKGADKVAPRSILVDLGIDESLEVPADAVVFVYALAHNGPAAPLAVQRFNAGRLPLRVRLDETMAMLPGMSLANFDEVIVIARVSFTGEVAPSPGDIEVRSAPLALNDESLALSLRLEKRI